MFGLGWFDIAYVAAANVLLLVVVATLVFAFHYYQRYKFEAELGSHWWKVRWDEVSLEEKLPRSFGTLRKSDEHIQVAELNNSRRNSSRRRPSSRPVDVAVTGTSVGFYKVRYMMTSNPDGSRTNE